MKELNRVSVSNFLIQDSITLEELELNKENEKYLSNNLIKIEDIFEENLKIYLNSSKLHHFLNGVMLTQKMQDGLYKIYNEDGKFIGLGTIKNELLKRDIILE